MSTQITSLLQSMLTQQMVSNSLLQNVLNQLISSIHVLTQGINGLINTLTFTTKMIVQSNLGQGKNFMTSITGGVPTKLYQSVDTALDATFKGITTGLGTYVPQLLQGPSSAGGTSAGKSRGAKSDFSGMFESMGVDIKTAFGPFATMFMGMAGTFKNLVSNIPVAGFTLGGIMKDWGQGAKDWFAGKKGDVSGWAGGKLGGTDWTSGKAAFGANHPLLSAPFKLIGAAAPGFSAIGQAARNIAKMPFQAIGQLGPQFMAMAFAIQPAMAFLEGILAPFEFITDYFGTFGEILGLMFLPIMQMLVPIFASFVPILLDVALTMQPIIGAIFNLIFQFSGLGFIIDLIKMVITSFLPVFGALQPLFSALMPLAEIFGNILGTVLGALAPLIELLANGLVRVLNDLKPLFDWLTEKLEWVAEKIDAIM